jgi:hypothetical protein
VAQGLVLAVEVDRVQEAEAAVQAEVEKVAAKVEVVS